MKKLTLVASVLLAGSIAVQAAPVASSADGKEELYMTGIYYDADDSDIYDTGYGFEAQGRYWLSDLLGFAVSGGFASWDIDDNVDLSPSGISGVDPVDDSVSLYTVGASALVRPFNGEKLKVTLEAGLRFIYIDSNVDLVGIDEDGKTQSTTVDPDSVFAGLIAADLEYAVSEKVSLIGGVGYQFTVIDGDIDSFGYNVGDSEVDALMVRAGATVKF